MSEPAPFGVPKLTRLETALVLAFAVSLFLFVGGPIWTHRWEPDRSILWSYTPLPVLVALCLLRGRRLRLASFLVETLKVLLLKFGITASILLVFWSFGEPPPPVRARALPTDGLETPVPSTPIPPPRVSDRPVARGELRGTVVGEDGAPLAGALVWVSGGLPAGEPSSGRDTALAISGDCFQPRAAIAFLGANLVVRSADGRLHTLHVIAEDGATVSNLPLLASGAERRIWIVKALGLCRLRCEVHPQERALLLVVGHGHAAVTDARGAFTLPGLPEGRLTVSAAAAGELRGEEAVTLVGGQTAEVRIRTRPRAE